MLLALSEPLKMLLPLLIGLIVGGAIGFLLMHVLPNSKVKKVEKESQEMLKKAEKESTELVNNATEKSVQIVKEAQNEAKEIVKTLKNEAEVEIAEKKKSISEQENKLSQRENNIDKRDILLQNKEATLDNKQEQLHKYANDLERKEADLKKKEENIDLELEKVASMTVQEAKGIIMEMAKEKSSNEVAAYLRNQEEEAKDKAKETARNILALSIQKYSQEVASERTVSVVSLPSDDLKGRIIGREGRNIRAIEQLTGTDLIIDDTPEIITVSCFNPIRREIARMSLETLIKDGRIQPGRIEEIVAKSTEEINETIHKAGEDAIFQLGLNRVSKELVDTIGKLKFRTSYGQNGLRHSLEVANLAGLMAAELGADQMLARRCGLFHDIGKALDFEMEGSHVELGVRLLKKYGEKEIVLNAVEAHHGDVEPTSLYANLVIAADTLSAARPGARSETLENYIQRIEKLEELSKGFAGVSQAYAIQAGREIRVMVVPEKVDDLQSYKLAREIREKIENELTYPGQIKVTVIREVRANEVAK